MKIIAIILLLLLFMFVIGVILFIYAIIQINKEHDDAPLQCINMPCIYQDNVACRYVDTTDMYLTKSCTECELYVP